MRTYLVGWYNNNDNKMDSEIVGLEDEQKANPFTFAHIIDNGLNHYHGYNCFERDIKYWSLIEY